MALLAFRRRLSMKLFASVSAVLVAVLLAGCSFSRTIVNDYVREIDTSWIVPGETTREDIIRRIGMPSTVKHMGGVGKDSFRWVTVDTRGKKLEVGYILTPTFEQANERYAHDLLIVFDKKGVVTLVSRTASDGERVKLLEWREAAR